ncbi:hypothetical protein ACC677_38070, partial [Rhizobium ruizarguesonis]
ALKSPLFQTKTPLPAPAMGLFIFNDSVATSAIEADLRYLVVQHEFADDAFIRDRESGLFLDPEKMHVIGHRGEELSVRGP